MNTFDDPILDPLNPDTRFVTPVEAVALLTRPQREKRVERLIEQANSIIDWAWEQHGGGKTLTATCLMYSGGNDSTVLGHLVRQRCDYAVHCNTTIGIEQTRQFVRDTCADWGLELIERTPPKSYRELILDKRFGGFPGPGGHFRYYSRLKERVVEIVRNELIDNPYKERLMLLAGRRRSESLRRTQRQIPLAERKGSVIWVSPICMWTKLDMNTYRVMMQNADDEVPVNQVSALLHMSGECLCGCFAKPDELEEIRYWFPDMATEIDTLMAEVKAAGFRNHVWGKRPSKEECDCGHIRQDHVHPDAERARDAEMGCKKCKCIEFHSAAEAPDQTGMMCSSCELTH